MTPFTRELVRDRAAHRCEYCRIPQYAIPDVRLHVEHIIARQHGGNESPDNLALACDRWNAFKGTNLTAVDPRTNRIVRLFHPREDQWSEHFGQVNYEIVGLTEIARATAGLLHMNAPRHVELRIALKLDLTLD